MKRLLSAGMVALLIVILGAGCYWLQRPAPGDPTIDKQIEELSQALDIGDWNRAEQVTEGIKISWHNIEMQVALNSSLSEAESFEDSLARLEVYVKEREAAEAKAELALMHESWLQMVSP